MIAGRCVFMFQRIAALDFIRETHIPQNETCNYEIGCLGADSPSD